MRRFGAFAPSCEGTVTACAMSCNAIVRLVQGPIVRTGGIDPELQAVLTKYLLIPYVTFTFHCVGHPAAQDGLLEEWGFDMSFLGGLGRPVLGKVEDRTQGVRLLRIGCRRARVIGWRAGWGVVTCPGWSGERGPERSSWDFRTGSSLSRPRR
jgi:hypothetical protein